MESWSRVSMGSPSTFLRRFLSMSHPLLETTPAFSSHSRMMLGCLPPEGKWMPRSESHSRSLFRDTSSPRGLHVLDRLQEREPLERKQDMARQMLVQIGGFRLEGEEFLAQLGQSTLPRKDAVGDHAKLAIVGELAAVVIAGGVGVEVLLADIGLDGPPISGALLGDGQTSERSIWLGENSLPKGRSLRFIRHPSIMKARRITCEPGKEPEQG